MLAKNTHLLWIFLLSYLARQAYGICPARCLCFRTTVRCMFLQLERIPKVPPETTILDVRFNRIQELPPGVFSGLKYLNTLLLNNNHIQKIENGVFDGLPELRYLYLYKNHISLIEENAFHGLEKLEQLYIHFNDIDDLPPNIFSKMPKLERLFLHNNKLERLPSGVFSNLSRLRRLRLDSNALVCDCGMMWLSEMLKEKRGHTQAAATCEYPSNVQGKSLLAVSHEDLHCRKPQFTVEPSDVEVTFGNTAYFSCSAEGDPQPQMVWLHNGHEVVTNSIDGSSRYSVLQDGTLMIENAQDADQGVYECVARNVAGEVRATAAELRYTGDPAAPRFVRTPRNTVSLEGERVSLECSASGHPNPRVSWSRDGLPLPNDPRFTEYITGTLTIDDVQYDDRGGYQCVVSNDLGHVSASARLQVQVPPRFVERPRDIESVDGHNIQMTCIASGHPTPVVTWSRDGFPLPSDSRISVSRDGSVLRIVSVEISDRGIYECQANNEVGRRAASAELVIKPRVSPRFVRTPVDHQVPQHGSVELQCGARGDPVPVVRWFRNSAPVAINHRTFVSEEGDLAIYNVSFKDEGLYECVAENIVGNIRAYARVTVLDEGSQQFIGDPFVDRSVREAILAVNRAFNNTLRELHNPSRPRTPNELLALFRLPSSSRALEITRSAEIYERALEIVLQHVQEAHRDGHRFNITQPELLEYNQLISPSHLAMIANLSNCAMHRPVINCTDMCFHHKYRSADGSCNNLQHPMWGSSLAPLNRLLKPVYENGFSTPVGWNATKLRHGFSIPSARTISLKIASAHEITPDEQYTHMLMQWGQFMDHDLDFVPQAVSNARFSDGRYCNETCDNQSPCFPIPVPRDDPRIHRHRCMGVTRSSAMCGSGATSVFFNTVSTREQLNQITHYMDASNIYGSSEEESRELRDISNQRGLLRTGIITPTGKDLLPSNTHAPVDCQMDPNTAHIPCFLAGDHRANEQLGLLSMHTIWMREHNRIAGDLLQNNPHWDGDMIYHEARKIVGAMLQHITYTHWLPKILGPIGMDILGEYKGYNPNIDASILNGFATGAFRFGHSLINPIIYRLNETFKPIPWGNLPLHRAFFAPFRIVEEGGIDPILRGLFGVAAKRLKPGELLNTELTEKLFKLAHTVSLDLASLNVQRGRDHGLPSYNAYRKYCGLTEAQTFEEFSSEIKNPNIREKLREVYGHPDNVELWIGGMVEDTLPGSRIGPTFMCIIAEQFKRTRNGDRFWYENPGVFSPAQLTEIKQATLARVICDNSDNIQNIQLDVFTKAEYPQGYIMCSSPKIPRVDLKQWTHCCHDCSQSGEFNSITGHILRRRRRALEYSFPPDEEITRNEIPISHGHVNQSHHGAKSHDKHHGSHDHQGNPDNPLVMTHGMMDSIDTRIEGVEGYMERLHRTLRKLNRKIRVLEQRVASGGLKKKDYCLDHRGKQKKNGDIWKEHDCRRCECKKGQLECVTETCQIPDCTYPKKIKGQCCPVC